MNKKKNICYVAEVDFEKGSAMSSRILNCVASISEIESYSVNLIGIGNSPAISVNGFEINNLKVGRNFIQKFFYLIFRGLLIIRFLKEDSRENDIIIYYGSSSLMLIPLRIYCRRKNIKLLVDLVEWYDYSHLPLGKYGPVALNVNYAITKVIPKCDGVIVISSFLEQYFKSKGKKTLLVPVLIDTNVVDNKLISPKSKPIDLIYAGRPGKKDLINNMILAVERFVDNNTINFHIFGCERADLEQILGINLSEKIICYGLVDQKKVYDFLKNCDFSVLLRPNKRYANAGFPTKFVESLNYGVPVIANITSDLSRYLKDGYNGYIVKGDDIESLTETLENIVAIDRFKLQELKRNARNTAIENFDFRLYSESFDRFLTSV